ncbi:MAG: ABC transporter ATP-binding protein [Anaerolineaceae bacterium]|nr:ABC transporter ATP-binding protein [Anaerolineaceae bacterium]
MNTSPVHGIEVEGLSKRYGSFWALKNCSFFLPQGRIAGLVGPNGAGKTTLMSILIGLLEADEGKAKVLGYSVKEKLSEILPKIGFLAQEHPLYDSFSVKEMFGVGRAMNFTWDDSFAYRKLAALEIPLKQKISKLSGGQRAQVALMLTLAKKPKLLILDEPFASLDPLARQDFMQILLEDVAENGQTVLISSHQISDLSRFCDSLVLLSRGSCLIAGDLEYLLASHCWLTTRSEHLEALKSKYPVITSRVCEHNSHLLLRIDQAMGPDESEGVREEVSLEDLVLSYLEHARNKRDSEAECKFFSGEENE